VLARSLRAGVSNSPGSFHASEFLRKQIGGNRVSEKNPSRRFGAVLKTFLFDTHLSPLLKVGYTAQAAGSKPVPDSLFHYLSVSLSFEPVVSMKGDGYVFRAMLACRYPLEAHLLHIVGQQGMEP